MTSDPVTCPYCNSLVSVAAGAVGGQRVSCSRCGESFALLPTDPAATADMRTQTDVPARPADLAPVDMKTWSLAKPIKANRRLAIVILGVMVFLAAGALAFALSTESFRRQNDKGLTQRHPKRLPPLDEAPPTDNAPTPPAQLAALAWLPRESSLLIGVHVRELSQNDAAKTLLTQPIQLGGAFSITVESLTKLIPFKIDDIDHLVLGVKLDDALPPRLTLVVRTRQEYDEAALLRGLEDIRKEKAGRRTVYDYRCAASPFGRVALCFLDSRTAVAAFKREHLEEIPASPQADLRQLPREVREVVQQRMGAVGPLWIAGHADNWHETALKPVLPVLLSNVKAANRKRLLNVRTFAAWVRLEDSVLVQATFDCGSERAAQELQTVFDIPDDPVNPAWKDGWLIVQFRTNQDKLRDALAR